MLWRSSGCVGEGVACVCIVLARGAPLVGVNVNPVTPDLQVCQMTEIAEAAPPTVVPG